MIGAVPLLPLCAFMTTAGRLPSYMCSVKFASHACRLNLSTHIKAFKINEIKFLRTKHYFLVQNYFTVVDQCPNAHVI
jgi:hypothetical protein